MKWFKHLTGSIKDPMIADLITEHGGDGYLVFFGILDMMAEDFNNKNPGVCTFSMKYLTRNLQLSRQKVVKILSYIEDYPKDNGKILHEINGDNITLTCIRLKELADEWTKRTLKSCSGVTTPIEEEVEVEIESEEETDKKKSVILFSDEDMKMSLLLSKLMTENNPERKKETENQLGKWANTCRLMREQDKRVIPKIEEIIVFSQNHDFWRNNINSMGKLRKQYDRLVLLYDDQRQEYIENEIIVMEKNEI